MELQEIIMLSPNFHDGSPPWGCSHFLRPIPCEALMNPDTIHEIQVVTTDILPIERTEDDEYEAIGDYHRQAAHHFSAAAKHHLKAAAADDEGDEATLILHAHMAYRHQLNGIQYAEIAAMESDLEADDEPSDNEGTE
jgi:hypothetical protein